MQEFKGTPGKWALGMDGEILSDAGYIVMGTDLVHGNENDLELIAAAPELIEALQDAEKALFAALDNAFGEELANGNRELIQARAAIAKALGG